MHRYVVIFLLGMSLVSCTSSIGLVTIPGQSSDDHLPVVTITAIPSDPTPTGKIEKDVIQTATGIAATQEVSNVDDGMSAQLIVSAKNGEQKTTGGVMTLTFKVTTPTATLYDLSTSGTKDANNMALNTLLLTTSPANKALTITVDAPVTATATATNFTGGTTTLTAIYVLVDPRERKQHSGVDIILAKEPGRNRYVGHLFNTAPVPNGTIDFLNGTGSSPAFSLLRADAPVSRCGDPAVSASTNPFGNLFPGDLTKLYGSEHPPLTTDIVACANPNSLPPELHLSVTYTIQ
jgi:hypothetical protein